MRMVSMARTPDDVKEELKECSPTSLGASVNAYPYGLCISLDKEILDKLGIDGRCEVGDIFSGRFISKVTSCSESERENVSGDIEEHCHIELQFTHLGVEGEDEDDEAEEMRETRAKRRYSDEGNEAA